MKSNITLVGMPGSGKSTVGVILAKRLGYSFVDVDLLIQARKGCLLKDIIREQGRKGFLQIENDINASLDVKRSIIAPGGSVIYGEEAMNHLKEISTVVYLKLDYTALKTRLGNLKDRGVALKKGMTLKDLYKERSPLYEKYADITIDEKKMDAGQVVDKLRKVIEKMMAEGLQEA